jgi:hypothetical protein
MSVSLRDIVEAILDQHDKEATRLSAPFRLGEIFFPIPRSENKALRFWPEYFRQGSTS